MQIKGPLDIALHFLKFRPRSVFEVRQKLKFKKISESEITKTLDVLIRNKLLDDQEFAKMYVRDRNLLKPTGSYLLRLELKRLGVADDIVEQVMIGQDDEELVKRALESKTRYRDGEFEKQAQFLQRRGFQTGLIYKILKNTHDLDI